MLDIVIPLGHGSKWHDNELRYGLRSIEKHLTGYRNVFIVGRCPDFLNANAIFLPQPFLTGNPAHNIAMNILEACRDERLSETFAYLNDDYFFTKAVDISTYPTYHKEALEKTYLQNNTDYRKHVRATILRLEELGLPSLNYDTHYPSIFDKEKMRTLIEGNDFARPFGFILKSLYFNNYPPAKAEFRADCKQHHIKKLAQWQELAEQTEVFSIADTCLNPTFKQFISEAYPTPSKWEK